MSPPSQTKLTAMGMLESYLVMEKARRNTRATPVEALSEEPAAVAAEVEAEATAEPAVATAPELAAAAGDARSVVEGTAAPAVATAPAANKRRYVKKAHPRLASEMHAAPASPGPAVPAKRGAGPAALPPMKRAVPEAAAVVAAEMPAAPLDLALAVPAGPAMPVRAALAVPSLRMSATADLYRAKPAINHEKTRSQFLVRSGVLGFKSKQFKYSSAASKADAEKNARDLLKNWQDAWGAMQR